MFVRELECTIQDVTKKLSRKRVVGQKYLEKLKRNPSAIVMVLAGKENTHFNLRKLPLQFFSLKTKTSLKVHFNSTDVTSDA